MAKNTDEILIIGSGLGSLSAAAYLCSEGLRPTIIEQNYLPGGCTSSYWRKGFVFDSGATTLVGFEPSQPLYTLFKKTNISMSTRILQVPMEVRLPNYTPIKRHGNIYDAIRALELTFPNSNQYSFWSLAYNLSQKVWELSTRYTGFPPATLGDLLHMVRYFKIKDVFLLPYLFKTVYDILKDYDLDKNPDFIRFIDAQLMITAQNHSKEVNFLFGSAALCYTQTSNFYVDGGLIKLIEPIVEYITLKGGELRLREKVEKVEYLKGKYYVHTSKSTYTCTKIISGIPINNTLEILDDSVPRKKINLQNYHTLNSALQIGIGFKQNSLQTQEPIHYQVHTPDPLPYIGSQSYFVSLSHPEDLLRSDEADCRIASISSHWPCRISLNEKEVDTLVEYVLAHFFDLGICKARDVQYMHVSGPTSWEKWTGRKYGFVGGYPQHRNLKPWQMIESRLNNKGFYLAGDSTYPGQGIPGVTLSGIIAAQKLIRDL